MTSVGIIGAGIGGLACARRLVAAGHHVRLFDKSRGLGGRMATRRGDAGTTFDHGAQYFTARDPRFANAVADWIRNGVARLWDARIVSLNAGVVEPGERETVRYVGVPTMNALSKYMADGLNILTDTEIQTVMRQAEKWMLRDRNGALHGPFDLVISNAPPVQTHKLFGPISPPIAARCDAVTMQPCWAAMWELARRLPLNFDAAFVQNSPLSWIARDSSKPQRTGETWVLHASPEWSTAHLEDDPATVDAALRAAFQTATGIAALPQKSTLHRWRYARPESALPESFLWDRETHFAACGDWCGGPRVEGAWLSGTALAEAILLD